MPIKGMQHLIAAQLSHPSSNPFFPLSDCCCCCCYPHRCLPTWSVSPVSSPLLS